MKAVLESEFIDWRSTEGDCHATKSGKNSGVLDCRSLFHGTITEEIMPSSIGVTLGNIIP